MCQKMPRGDHLTACDSATQPETSWKAAVEFFVTNQRKSEKEGPTLIPLGSAFLSCLWSYVAAPSFPDLPTRQNVGSSGMDR